MKNLPLVACIAIVMACTTVNSIAQKALETDTAKKDLPKAEKFVTRHSIKIDSKLINYTATVGTMVIKNEKDEPVASIGYTYYLKEGETSLNTRPVIFSYNGGPGSSSVYLHMGILGPRKVVQTGSMAPFRLEDNNNTLLDVADIVLIDPVGTGFSRPAGKGKFTDFWGVEQDIKSVSFFIKSFINEYEEWTRSKFLIGESYGTFRSAGVANYLQEKLGITLNGIVLVSNVLDLRTLTFNPGDDISYIVTLPTYSASAWYHNKLRNKPADLFAFLKEAREYAFGEYATALMKGDQLPPEEREKQLDKLTLYTGLSKD
jgi:carboxypeptidase C (cathepsin A)